MLNKMIVPFLFAALLAGCGNKDVLLETDGDLPIHQLSYRNSILS